MLTISVRMLVVVGDRAPTCACAGASLIEPDARSEVAIASSTASAVHTYVYVRVDIDIMITTMDMRLNVAIVVQYLQVRYLYM